MRSIGKVKIRKLRKLVTDVWTKFKQGKLDVQQQNLDDFIIHSCVPVEWWDIWESADSEIHRIVSDELAKKAYGVDLTKT